eukprot:m.24769 g.24769  ORF g.24769 m.24769 type:complete len:325 (-) comp8637_c0_seq1:1670-2644(-)
MSSYSGAHSTPDLPMGPPQQSVGHSVRQPFMTVPPAPNVAGTAAGTHRSTRMPINQERPAAAQSTGPGGSTIGATSSHLLQPYQPTTSQQMSVGVVQQLQHMQLGATTPTPGAPQSQPQPHLQGYPAQPQQQPGQVRPYPQLQQPIPYQQHHQPSQQPSQQPLQQPSQQGQQPQYHQQLPFQVQGQARPQPIGLTNAQPPQGYPIAQPYALSHHPQQGQPQQPVFVQQQAQQQQFPPAQLPKPTSAVASRAYPILTPQNMMLKKPVQAPWLMPAPSSSAQSQETVLQAWEPTHSWAQQMPSTQPQQLQSMEAGAQSIGAPPVPL